MTPQDFNTIKKQVTAYWATLDILEIRAEFAKKGLLTQNTKLAKGEDLVENWGLELLPSVLGPINTCEGAGLCRYTCLAFSGVNNILKGNKMIEGKELSTALMAKARRTFFYVNDRDYFDALLKIEIQHRKSLAELNGNDFKCRLNVTSDLDWSDFVADLPNVMFYDYTKVWTRKSQTNYHLTFSASEKTNEKMIQEKLEQGENVAVVFEDVPENYLNFPVIDGDKDDNRYNDPKGVVVGLKLKVTVGGKHKTDFVK